MALGMLWPTVLLEMIVLLATTTDATTKISGQAPPALDNMLPTSKKTGTFLSGLQCLTTLVRSDSVNTGH